MIGGKMRLPESPYTFVRTTVMKTLLIAKSDYEKLLKMSLSEISNYLGQTEYKREINELALSLSGIELVERALDTNFVRTIEKLKRISPPAYTAVIDAYLMRYDVENIKTILRVLDSKPPFIELKKLLLPGGILSLSELEVLYQKKTLEEVMRVLPQPFDRFFAHYKTAPMKARIELENALDHFYFEYLLDFASKIPRQGKFFREFLLSMVEMTNLLTYLRLKKEGFHSKDIRPYLLLNGNLNYFELLLKAKNDDEAKKIIKRRYPEISFGESLITTEIELHKHLYKKTLLFQHQDPLSVYVILGYLFEKETEIMNLKKIIKAKHLGIDPKKVESFLVAV